MCVCVRPNKDLTSVRTAPANPAKTDGEKWAIFVPQLFHILIVQRTTRILSVSCGRITQSNDLLRAGGSRGSAGPAPPPHRSVRPRRVRGQTNAAALVFTVAVGECDWGSVKAGAALFALMRRREEEEEEFVFTAIYRREWCL